MTSASRGSVGMGAISFVGLGLFRKTTRRRGGTVL
jgi:hypothetical protein